MQRGPVERKTKGAARQISGHQFQLLNVNLRVVSLIEHVKMRRWVVGVVRANNNTVKTVDCGHGGTLAPAFKVTKKRRSTGRGWFSVLPACEGQCSAFVDRRSIGRSAPISAKGL